VISKRYATSKDLCLATRPRPVIALLELSASKVSIPSVVPRAAVPVAQKR